jgi:single-stranded-DNA-specific exonuclease
VVGIVAGRLASRFGKPTIVLALDGARGRGSARAPAGFSVYDALVRVQGTLIGFGGHHAAAGVDVASDRVETLRDRFAEACAAMGVPDSAPRWAADAMLEDGDDPARVLGDLTRFEPCGQSNPSPRVASARARVLGVRELRGGHLKAWLEVGGTRISCFGPEMGGLATRLGSHARVVGALRHDTYTGGGAVEMRLVAAEPAETAESP